MRPGSSIDSLNPTLERALSHLDIKLEEEIARYRRQRSGLSVSPTIIKPKKKKPKALDLISFASPAMQTVDAPIPQANVAGVHLPPKAVSSDIGNTAPSSQVALVPYESQSAGEALQQATQADSDTAEHSAPPPNDYLESSEELLRSLEQEETNVQAERGFLESLVSPLGVGAMLMFLVLSAMFGYFIVNPPSFSGISRSLVREEASSSTDSSTEESTSADSSEEETPSSPLLDSEEFVDLGLENLTVLKTQSNPNLPSPVKPSPQPSAAASATGTDASSNTASRNTSGTSSNSSSSNTPASGTDSTAGNSAATSPRSSYRSSGASASSGSHYSTSGSHDGASSSSGTASSYSTRRKSYNPAPVRRTRPSADPVPPAPRSLPPKTASVSPPAQGSDYTYKVEVPYTGDRSLEEARKIVPGAYLRSDGKIQLGAAANQEQARQAIQSLKNQGISAEVNQR